MFKDIVRVNGKQYEVSTVDTDDNGWETIIFEQSQLRRQWYVACYPDGALAYVGHADAIRRAAEVIAADPDGYPWRR